MLNSRGRRILNLCLVLAAFATEGCVPVPVKVQPQIQGPESTDKAPNPSAIQPGITTRETIVKDWGWSDVHVDCERLFVGQMSRSTEKWVTTFVGIPMGSERDWQNDLLFVEFDERGVVAKDYFVPPNHLYGAMIAFLESTPTPKFNLSSPKEIGGSFDFRGHLGSHNYRAGKLFLRDDAIEYLTGVAAPTATRVRIETARIKKFHLASGFIFESLELQDMPRGQHQLEFELKPADAFVLVRYVQQVAPGALPVIKPKAKSQSKK